MNTIKYINNHKINLKTLKSLLNEEHEEIMNEGYAATLLSSDKLDCKEKIKNDFTWFIFKNVDEHIDGQGLSTLFIVEGHGNFYIEDQIIKLKSNDLIQFSDKVEHGFSSDDYCIALNISWGDSHITENEILETIERCIIVSNDFLDNLNIKKVTNKIKC